MQTITSFQSARAADPSCLTGVSHTICITFSIKGEVCQEVSALLRGSPEDCFHILLWLLYLCWAVYNFILTLVSILFFDYVQFHLSPFPTPLLCWGVVVSSGDRVTAIVQPWIQAKHREVDTQRHPNSWQIYTWHGSGWGKNSFHRVLSPDKAGMWDDDSL